jgi:RNA polymerase sigma-70 factor (ECF subfamily)
MKEQTKNKADKADLKWIRRAKQGNQQAFEKLVIKYQKRIYFSVRKMVLDHDDTNDIVQDTFVKSYSNLHRFDEHYAFYPWLHRIAVNTTLNFKTKTARVRSFSIDSDENEVEQIAENDDNPLSQVMASELKKKISDALQQLPFDQRMVFMLRTSENLSYQQISDQLDISMGTVMSRLARARAKLRELLQPYLTEQKNKV